MAKVKTAGPAIPAPVLLGFAELNEQAAAILEALNAMDLDRADRLRATIKTLDDGSDPDQSFDWRWKSGLEDWVDLMGAIRKLAGDGLEAGDNPTVGACNWRQVTELVEMVRERAARRRVKATPAR